MGILFFGLNNVLLNNNLRLVVQMAAVALIILLLLGRSSGFLGKLVVNGFLGGYIRRLRLRFGWGRITRGGVDVPAPCRTLQVKHPRDLTIVKQILHHYNLLFKITIMNQKKQNAKLIVKNKVNLYIKTY
jgi:hypothetical protein